MKGSFVLEIQMAGLRFLREVARRRQVGSLKSERPPTFYIYPVEGPGKNRVSNWVILKPLRADDEDALILRHVLVLNLAGFVRLGMKGN